MKKLLITAVFVMASFSLYAKSEYIYTDHRFNYVKLEDLSKKDAESIQPTQPYTTTEEDMRAVLKSLKLSRNFIIKKEVEDQDIFSEKGINFLAHKLVEGLLKATDKQKVVFSYLAKEPVFVLRNDRITIGYIWAKSASIHFKFEKLYAKLLGDTDKKGDFPKLIARAKGLRIELELDACQSYGDSTSEIVVDVACATGKTKEGAATAEVQPTPAGKDKKDKAVKETAAPVAQAPMTTRDRLKELEQLKMDGLITESEYKRKRRDVLKGL